MVLNLNVNKTTIYRELKRNSISFGSYIADDADKKIDMRKQRYSCIRKLNDKTKNYVEGKLKRY